jgi:hypothetical protein
VCFYYAGFVSKLLENNNRMWTANTT